MRIEWHPLAHTDLVELVTFIAKEDPGAAYRIHDEIRQQTAGLAIFSEIGRVGRVRGTRELVITGTPYIVAYCLPGDRVIVLRVLHGARQWPRKIL